jgi:hypothetical protein
MFSYFLNTSLSLVIILSCQNLDSEEESKAEKEGVVSRPDLIQPKIRVDEFSVES